MRDTQQWVKPPLSPSNLVYGSTLHSLAVCGRLSEKQFFDNAVAYNNGSGTPTERLVYTYDAFGRIVQQQHIRPTVTDTYTTVYDSQGRVTQETTPTGTIQYQYDVLGRKTQCRTVVSTVPTDILTEITYTYDLFGRLSTVNTVRRDGAIVDSNGAGAGTPPESTAYFYDLLGRPDYTQLPNGVIEDYTFDAMDRMDLMAHRRASDNAVLASYDYTYRADGKRTGLNESFATTTARSNSYTWSYDNAGRLISEVLDSSDNSVDQTESYVYDLVGNRMRKEVNKPATAYVDQIFAYNYDANDRITSETLDNGANGAGVDQTTTYGWNGTQQATRSVSEGSITRSVQSMSYGLGGQLERVVTTTSNGSGTVTGRSRVDYRYTPQGIRTISVDWTDANLDGTFAAGERTGSVEYLIENANFTGYQQTILETVKNAAGQATKRTSYTFGADEITQTTTLPLPGGGEGWGEGETLTFAHDGKGSVRALFGAAAAIAQVFTYSAYGELLAIHNGSGTLQPLTSSLTSVLYNGEGLDARTGLYNMRARWYSASDARWERLDPFNGNPNDPFSFNKYGFVHGDPVQGIDPTGMFFSVGGFFSASAISGAMRGMNQFAVYAGRQAAIAGIETGIEVVIGNLIAAATGVSFDNDPNEIARTFATNAASNIATAGIGNKTRHAILLRNMLDFAVRMVSDVAIGGENIMWAAAVNLMSFGASGLLLAKYGQKMFGECVARFGGCFVAGTQVVTGYLDDPWESDLGTDSSTVGVAARRTVTQSIETIELGSRVITEAPDGLPSDSEYGEPEQSTWRKITMLQQRRDGSRIETEVLRPNRWIELLGLKEGSVIEFDLPELQTSGIAKIQSIEPCPPIAEGEGRVVIGRFVTRQVSNLLEVELENGTSFTGTSTHPVWSVDASDWRAMEELVVGERLQTLTGEVTIRAIRDARRVSDVFNIEVDGEHVYRLLDAGVLVHNARYDFLDIEHVFKGSRGGGFHHHVGELAGTAKVSGAYPCPANPWGVYKAYVLVLDTSTGGFVNKKPPGYSTFFPKHWNVSKTAKEIEFAFKGPLQQKSTNAFVGKSSEGMPIRLIIMNGRVETAYPDI